MTDNTPETAAEQDAAYTEPTLEEKLNSLPKFELERYRHGKWADHIHTEKSNEVLTPITLEELMDAQREGTKLPLLLVNGYKAEVIGDEYNYQDNDDKSYLMGDKVGNHSIAVRFTEQVIDIEVNVASITVKQDAHGNSKPDPQNWEATIFQPYSVQYNYNAGSETARMFYTLKSVEGKLTWQNLEDTDIK